MKNPRVSVVLVAAGEGARMGRSTQSVGGRRRSVRKPFLAIDGKPMVMRSLETFRSVRNVAEVILVLHRDDIVWVVKTFGAAFSRLKVAKIVSGGARRQDSVWNGLRMTDARNPLVAIHDAARPFVDAKDIARAIRAAAKGGAAILAVPARDTIKEVDARGRIVRTPDRRTLWHAQTPQIFKREIILAAHRLRTRGSEATDDAGMVEHLGRTVVVVEGSPGNVKITTPDDIVRTARR